MTTPNLAICSTAEMTAEATVKLCIYAPSGTGKTMLSATAPKPLILSAEAGLLSLRKANIERVFGVDTPGITYDVPFVTCTSMQELGDVYQWLTESPDAMGFETVILDSVTDIAEVVLANAKKEAKDPRQAYGQLADQMMMILRAFRNLPNHNVVFLAKLDKVNDELSGGVLFGPMMPGQQLSKQLPYLFDEVLSLEAGQPTEQGLVQRYFRCHKDWQWDVKDRSGALAQYETAHLGYIFNKVRS